MLENLEEGQMQFSTPAGWAMSKVLPKYPPGRAAATLGAGDVVY